MTFGEQRIDSVNYLDPAAVYSLIVRDLCGERYHREFGESDRRNLTEFLALADTEGLTYERFNELLLLLEQDRVSESFYKLFFGVTDPLKLRLLAKCVVDFRGYAMLRYGNIRFAYKDLSKKSDTQLARSLHPYLEAKSNIEARYSARPSCALQIEAIDRDKTWCLGYIARLKHDKESKVLAELINSAQQDQEILALGQIYEALGETIEQTKAKGLRNTDVYLTWDFMDVYVATSMRKQWEFEDVSEFVTALFSNSKLSLLKLRYFDPTQSNCTSRIDKGLVEALMLKRASCTVYLVQEADTFGKDSELASTLAQGKPVIAFVPSLDVEAHATKIRAFPLDFFKIRFRVLQAEGVLEEPDLSRQLSEADANFLETVNSFLDAVNSFFQNQPFTLWESKQTSFKNAFTGFDRICKLLAIAEKYNFDKRATVLKGVHPLSLQVHLGSGVANGVLVVRTVQECADVLRGLLTNSLDFSIEFDSRMKCTLLKEKTSQSPFRAVTEHEKLSNSFWNFYLHPVSGHLNKQDGTT
jgi:hypothetical protein